MLNNGVEAGSGELGYNIEVYGQVCDGTNLEDCLPNISDDDELAAFNEQGKWWFATTFQYWDICT